MDIDFKNNKYFYYFKNLTFSSEVEPKKFFERHGYDKTEVKTAPIAKEIKERLLGVIKRF
jgi:hypothetical protein